MLPSFAIKASNQTICLSFNDISLYLIKNVVVFFQSYDGGFGLIPGSESHGEWIGILYCCVICLLCSVHVQVAN